MSELRVDETDDSVTFDVRVSPRASRNAILGIHDGALKVAVTAPPIDGAANTAVIRLLAKHLTIPKSTITILQGTHARTKRIRIAIPGGQVPLRKLW